MRLLIATGIYEPDIGGPASYARALGQQAASVHYVTILTYSSVWKSRNDKEQPFAVVRVWRWWPRGIRHIMYLMRMALLGRHHDTILALNAVSAGIPARLVAHWQKQKLFIRVVGDYAWETAIQRGNTALLVNDFQKEPHTSWIAFLHRQQVAVCRAAHGIIVPSEYLAELVQGWGIDRGKIEVIYNGVVPVVPPPTKEAAKKKIGLAGSLIVSVGRLVPWKGFRMLIKIMPKLLQINQFFRLVIVGVGPDMGVLQAMVRNLGLERKVLLMGKKQGQELVDIVSAGDIFILNTGYEGFSHQVLEAMMCGVPVITTAVGGNREVVRQGENGFLVKYNDEFNLIEGIRTLWQMPELRQEFVEQGRATVEQFPVSTMVRRSLEFISS